MPAILNSHSARAVVAATPRSQSRAARTDYVGGFPARCPDPPARTCLDACRGNSRIHHSARAFYPYSTPQNSSPRAVCTCTPCRRFHSGSTCHSTRLIVPLDTRSYPSACCDGTCQFPVYQYECEKSNEYAESKNVFETACMLQLSRMNQVAGIDTTCRFK